MTTFKQLRELITFKGGGTPSKQVADYWNGDIPWATVKDFTSTSLSETQDFISREGLRNSSATLIPKGHVIIPTRMSLGKAAINTVDLAINQDLRALVPKVPLDTRFLLHAILSLKEEIVGKGTGATVKGITQDELYKLEIAFPLLDDQIRIAHLLSKVEELIAQRKQHLQQLDDLLKSEFLEMFGDPQRNERGWNKFPIDQIVENARNGLSPSKGGKFDGLVYTLSSVTGGAFREIFKKDVFSKLDNSYIPSARDFLVCRGNGNINLVGRGHFYPAIRDDIMFPDTVIALTIKEGAINSKFLEALWQTKFIRAQIEKITRTANGTFKINQKSLCKVEIFAPPSEKQGDFEKFAAKLEKLGTKYKQTLVDLEALYGALSQQAFKGELDLSRVPLPDNQGSQIHGEQLEQQADRSSLPLKTLTPTEAINNLVQSAQPQGRGEMLAHWFSRYLANTSPDVRLGSAQLFEAAWQTLQETQLEDGGETPALTLDDYDALKDSIFKALASGELNQTFDADSNRVALQKRSANWGTW